jgi:hypothetical protein
MAYTFTNATLLTYQVNKNYLGEGIVSLNERAKITIKGVFDNRLSNPHGLGVNQTISSINSLLLTTSNVYDDIIVNGFNLGKGIITNISFPDNNPIIIGDYTYEIEVVKSTDFSNLSSNSSIYGSTLYNLKDLINNFDEKFDFNYAEDGTYTCKHSITLQYFNDKTDVITKCKNLASILFNENLSLGLIGKFANAYSSLRTQKNYYSESYDLINKSCVFSKEIEINENLSTNYSNKISHSLTFNEDGKVTIQEQGLIKALDNTQSFTADNYFSTELNKSFTRCQTIFDAYTSKYGLNSKDSLYNSPHDLGKTINLVDNSLEYSVSYLNDPSFEGSLTHNYSITISQNADNINTYSEEGEIFLNAQLGTILNLNQFKTKYLDAKNRANSSYPTYNLSNSSINYERIGSYYGNKFTYKIEKNNEQKNKLSDSPQYKSLEFTIEDTSPSEIYKEYIIANRNPKNILFSDGNQVEMGSRRVQINGVLTKPALNIWSTPLNIPLNDLKNIAVSNAFGSLSTDAYITDVTYGYSSDYSFSFSLTIMYLK